MYTSIKGGECGTLGRIYILDSTIYSRYLLYAARVSIRPNVPVHLVNTRVNGMKFVQSWNFSSIFNVAQQNSTSYTPMYRNAVSGYSSGHIFPHICQLDNTSASIKKDTFSGLTLVLANIVFFYASTFSLSHNVVHNVHVQHVYDGIFIIISLLV